MALASPQKTWGGELTPLDDAWWSRHYAKIHDTEECKGLEPHFAYARKVDQGNGTMSAHVLLGSLYWLGPCFDQDLPLAEHLLTQTAERGQSIAALYLAQFYFLAEGESAPRTQEWLQRAKLAMPLLSGNWKRDIYPVLKARFEQSGERLSPHLEDVFNWYRSINHGDPEVSYQIGLDLLEKNTYSESKVLACNWFYKAETRDHVKARYQLGRQLALGDGVKVAPGAAMLMIQKSANIDKNPDAFLLAARLLQEGDVFERNLPDAYFALLKAKALGADVTEQLKTLEPQLTKKERERAQSWANFEPALITLDPKGPYFSQPSCSYSSR